MVFDFRSAVGGMCARGWLSVCVMVLALGAMCQSSAGQDVPAERATVTCRVRNQKELDQLDRLWGRGGFSIDKKAKRDGVPSVRMEGPGSNCLRTKPVPYSPGDRIRIRADVKAKAVQPTGTHGFAPVLAIQFYDGKMESLGHKDIIGFYKGDTAWRSSNNLQGPFPLTVKFWSIYLSTGYVKSGTVWVNNLMLARVPEEKPAEWESMLMSRSFGVDELTKGDWRILRSDDTFVGKPNIDRAPDED